MHAMLSSQCRLPSRPTDKHLAKLSHEREDYTVTYFQAGGCCDTIYMREEE